MVFEIEGVVTRGIIYLCPLMKNGSHDPIVPRHRTEDLYDLLGNAGANISIQWQNSGHELTQRDVKVAREWAASELLI